MENLPPAALLTEIVLPRNCPGGESVTSATKFDIDRGHPVTWRFIGVPVVRMQEESFVVDCGKAERAFLRP